MELFLHKYHCDRTYDAMDSTLILVINVPVCPILGHDLRVSVDGYSARNVVKILLFCKDI